MLCIISFGHRACENHSTLQVDESFELQIGAITVTALATPCHTPGHVTYVASCGQQPKAAFTGDTYAPPRPINLLE